MSHVDTLRRERVQRASESGGANRPEAGGCWTVGSSASARRGLYRAYIYSSSRYYIYSVSKKHSTYDDARSAGSGPGLVTERLMILLSLFLLSLFLLHTFTRETTRPERVTRCVMVRSTAMMSRTQMMMRMREAEASLTLHRSARVVAELLRRRVAIMQRDCTVDAGRLSEASIARVDERAAHHRASAALESVGKVHGD